MQVGCMFRRDLFGRRNGGLEHVERCVLEMLDVDRHTLDLATSGLWAQPTLKHCAPRSPTATTASTCSCSRSDASLWYTRRCGAATPTSPRCSRQCPSSTRRRLRQATASPRARPKVVRTGHSRARRTHLRWQPHRRPPEQHPHLDRHARRQARRLRRVTRNDRIAVTGNPPSSRRRAADWVLRVGVTRTTPGRATDDVSASSEQDFPVWRLTFERLEGLWSGS